MINDNTTTGSEHPDVLDEKSYPYSPLATAHRFLLSDPKPAAGDAVISDSQNRQPPAVLHDTTADDSNATRKSYISDLEGRSHSNCGVSANSGQWGPDEDSDIEMVHTREEAVISDRNIDEHLKGILVCCQSIIFYDTCLPCVLQSFTWRSSHLS